jgi:hypothetical protein
MSKSYGILGLFDTPQAVYAAAKEVRDAGYSRWDCHTPFPLHGLDEAMGLKRSKVPVFTFIGGFTGFWTGWTIAWFMGAFNYPLIVGGKPFFDFVFPFPVAYELTILLSAFGTLGGMFILNRLPMHYHPVMNYEKFRRLTDDQFAIVIEASDPDYDEAKVKALFEKIGAIEVTVVNEEEAV